MSKIKFQQFKSWWFEIEKTDLQVEVVEIKYQEDKQDTTVNTNSTTAPTTVTSNATAPTATTI